MSELTPSALARWRADPIAFIEQCLDNPNAKAQDIMMKIKG